LPSLAFGDEKYIAKLIFERILKLGGDGGYSILIKTRELSLDKGQNLFYSCSIAERRGFRNPLYSKHAPSIALAKPERLASQ
jgi:hypothetical protein